MSDFVKIFVVLCLCVAGFMFGRDYGEKTFRETADYKELVKAKDELSFTKSELENVKTKFQNIVDGSDNKKQEELLTQILQVFLADLGIRVSEYQQAHLKLSPAVTTPVPAIEAKPEANKEVVEQKPAPKAEKVFDMKKLKSYEWILSNSSGTDEINKNLKNVEIKNLNEFLASAKQQPVESFEPIFGKYRGHIVGVDNKEYGLMVVEISTTEIKNVMHAVGAIEIIKENRDTMSNRFSTNTLGYTADGSTSFLINPGSDNKFYQIYKIKATQQLAGFFYERLAHGTTKTIGSFLLNRTDQF